MLRYLRIGLAVLPVTLLLHYGKSIYPFITLKVASFTILVGLVGLIWLALISIAPRYRPRLTNLNTVLLGLLTVLTIASIIGVNPLRSFWSVQERAIGVIGLWHLYLWYLMLASLMRNGDGEMVRIVRWHFWISTAVAATAILQRISPSLFFVIGNDRPGGTLGNPSYLASYIAITLFLGVWLFYTTKNAGEKRLLVAAVALQVAVLMLTETRGAILGLTAAFMFCLWWLAQHHWRTHQGARRYVKNWALLGLIALVIFGAIFSLTRRAPVWQQIPGIKRIATLSIGGGTSQTRLIAWGAALDAAKERPLLGYGFENFRYPFDARFDPRLLRAGLGDTYFDKPHNIPLEMLVSGGVPAFGLYLGLIGVLIWRLRRLPHGWVLIAATISYFVQGLFVFDTIGSYVAVFALFALSETAGFTEARSHRNLPTWVLPVSLSVASLLWLLSTSYQLAIFYSNINQYHILNSFANRTYLNAFEYREKALAWPTPYTNNVHENFLTVAASGFENDQLPEPKKFIELALAGYKKTLARDPHNYFLYINRADAEILFSRLGEEYGADIESDLARANELSPNRQQTHYVRSKYELSKGNVQEAYKEMKAAVDLDPLASDPHYYYGVLAYQDGQSEVGLSEFKKAVELGWVPNTADAATFVAGYMSDAGEDNIAYNLFHRAVELNPKDTDARLKLAITAYYIGRFEEAKGLFESLMNEKELTDPNSPVRQELQPIFDQLGVVRPPLTNTP